MISRRGVAEFLARPMRDSATAKELSDATLDRMIAKAGLRFHTKPRHAQKVCTLLGWKYHSYLMLLGMGGGKTKISLDLFANRKRKKFVDRCLVFVPNVVNLGTWAVEVKKHAPHLTVAVLDQEGSAARWETLESDADIVVGTYHGLTQLMCGIEKKKGKNRMKAKPKLLKRMADLFQMVVLDEITAIMNPQSLWFKIIRSLQKQVKFIYGLTGTPFDKTPAALWSQFFVIDNGYTLGETLGLYRAVFFKSEWGYFGGMNHTFIAAKKGLLARRLRNCSVRYSEAECQDLPKAVGGITGELMLVPVTLPKEQQPYYDSIDDEMKGAGNNLTLVEAAYTRMRMVCSGWLGAKTETGEKAEIVFQHNPKFDAVVDLLEQIPEHEKVIVVCWFNVTCRLLMERLKQAKQSAVCVNGKTSNGNKKLAMAAFETPGGGPRVLVASTAISKGVNLQAAARRMIFVETPDSSIDRKQMEARIRREGGLKGPRYYYDVVVAESVDQKILRSLVEGRKLHDVLVDRA